MRPRARRLARLYHEIEPCCNSLAAFAAIQRNAILRAEMNARLAVLETRLAAQATLTTPPRFAIAGPPGPAQPRNRSRDALGRLDRRPARHTVGSPQRSLALKARAKIRRSDPIGTTPTVFAPCWQPMLCLGRVLGDADEPDLGGRRQRQDQ